MPFLKPLKSSVTKWRTEAGKRNGSRRSIFIPNRPYTKKRYTGEWRDDKKHGKGTEFNTHNSLMYEGDWLDGAKHGYGVLSKKLENNSIRKIYSGHWVNGKREGSGSYWYDNGDYYEGGFVENKRQGFGRIWKTDGTFYQGTWNGDLPHGEGLLVFANGNRFEGNFRRGKREGRGIYVHVRTGQLYEGFWLADTSHAGTLEDTYWRQSSSNATPYPIPNSRR